MTQGEVTNGIMTFVSRALAIFMGLVAATSFGIVVVRPHVENWLDAYNAPFYSRLAGVEEKSDVIEAEIKGLRNDLRLINRPFIEFLGDGKVSNGRTYTPGSTVQVVYQLRRNLPCQTTVRVQFFDHSVGRINTSLTYEITATQAGRSTSFQHFVVDVELPLKMPPGEYSYSPELVPEDCNNYEPVLPPMSDLFVVSAE